MSNTIDQRVVEMRFDNKQFESGVSTTMSTLDKLKQKLNLTGASKGLDSLNTAAKNVNMSGLGSAVETVTAKFSALQVMGVTALANITNSAVNAGKSIVKSLTIDPIKSGFEEYETKMGSIQTILANTEHQGTTLNDVTRALDELNTYADKTIYNFQQMTRNIGTFTAAGIDLDTSVRSIQGIANLAAVSGSTSQQASTAMYQLSQALATGTVKLMDWNSVVNAGMGGKVFQNALIQTAAMLDGAAADVQAWQKENIDAYGSFRESLTQGEWLTAEVLTKTLEQFTMAAEEGSAQWEEFKKSLMDDGYTEAQAESILKMANTATDAATKVKTFTQLMDTLKESAQSGWAQTWELIVGDFEEAKSFFTELSDLFGGIIGKSADRRNSLFGDALGSNWDKLINKINDAGIETEKFEESIRKVVGDKKLDKLIEDWGSLEEAVKKGKISTEDLQKAFDGVVDSASGNKFASFVDGLKEIERTLRRGNIGEDVKKLQTALDELGYDLGSPGVDGIIGPLTENAIKAFQEANGIIADGVAGPETIAALEKAGTKVENLTGNVDDLKLSAGELINEITKTSGRELLLDSLMNVIKAIHRPLAAVGEAFRNVFSVTPDQLYGALEGLNKFTDKFVMKGLLDIGEWNKLTEALDKAGVSSTKFKQALIGALKDNNIDPEKLIKKYGSLDKAFNKGAISADIVKEALINLGLSEAFINGGENADKLRRAFEGLFAIFKVFGSFVGGGFKFAFKVLTSVLGAFDMNILDLVANMGDALVAFRDWVYEGNLIAQMFDNLLAQLPGVVDQLKEWFNAFKQTPAVQKLVTAIEAIQSAFNKLMSGDINISEFANSLGTNLANALKSLPEIAVQIASDFIAGFVGGLGSGVSGVISDIVNFCTEFVSAFAAALGVQSPSWKAYDIAVDFIQGFVNGIKTIVGTVASVLKNVGNQIVKIFKSLWDYITDESGNIEWGKIIAGGIIFSALWILKTFATAFSGIAKAFKGLDNIFENIGRSIKSFSKVLNAYAWDLKAQALQKLAIAIAILAASVWVLAQIESPGRLIGAVATIVALAFVVVGLAYAMDKLSAASVKIDKSGANIDGLKTGIMQIGIVLLLLAATVKLIGSMNPEEAKQGFIGLAGMAVGLVLFMAAMTGLSKYAKNVDKIGGMMIKLSIAMLLLIAVVKLVDGLSPEEMGKGVIFAGAFAIFVRSITAVAKSAGNNVSKVGGMAVKLVIAMGLMVGVVKLASMLSAEEMLKGAAFAAGFVLFVKGLVACTKIGKKQQLAKLSGLILSISFSMALMVGVCKLINKLTVAEILKGAAFMAGFAVFLKVLVGILKIGSDQQLAKVTGTILALSVAIGILAGVAALLSLIDLAGLAKGVGAVTVLGLVMAGMVKALRGAQDVKSSIMMMAIAIGVMAAAVVALSFIDPSDLAGATAALSAVMGMFALMVKASSGAKASIGSMSIMLGAIVILAGVLIILSNLEVGSTLEVAASISMLMLTLGVTMQLISKAGAGASAAIGPMFALTVVLGIVAAILGIMAHFDIEPSIETAASLSILLLSLAGVTAVLTLVGAGAPAALGGIAAFAIVVAGIGALITALGYLNDKCPSLQKFLDSGIPILEKIGVGIGKFVGGIIGGIGEGMMDSLLSMVETFKTVMEKLVEVSDIGTGVKMEGFDGIKKLLGVLGSIGLTTVGTTLADVFTLGGTSMEKFQTDGVAFFEAMKAISQASSDVTMNEAAMDAVISVAQDLADLQSSLEPIGGVISWFTGRDDLATFGANVGLFIESMKTALASLDGSSPDTSGLAKIIVVAIDLSKLQSSLEPIGGVISWFAGRDDLGTFGTNVGVFIESMKNALGSLEGFSPNTEALAPIITASADLAKLQSSLEPIGGVITWFAGRDDLGTFGTNVGTFIESMKTALSSLEGTTLDQTALTSVITAATELSKLQEKLEPMGGVISWFAGRSDLGTFGTNVGLFADAMGKLKTGMGEDGISEAVVTSITNAGNAIISLQQALPEEGWFDGKMNLSEFSGYITDFGTAMGTFATAVGEINFAAIDSSINAANRIRTLIEMLSGLDASGVASFAGVGFGDGHLVNIGQAIGAYGDAVADLNIEAVSTSVTAATRLRSLIAGLTGLDASGIENFKIGSIGTAIKDYSNEVADVDVSVISTSISAANRLKNFITSLVGLDVSGIANFKPHSIGSAIKTYAANVGGVDIGAILASINAANRLRSLISSLSGVDTSGVSSFKSAISELATVNIDGLVSAFSGSVDAVASAVNSIIDVMANGINSGSAKVSAAMTSLIGNVMTAARARVGQFIQIGQALSTNLANGMLSKGSAVSNAGKTVASNAASGASSGYAGMHTAGIYLGQGLVAGIAAMEDEAYAAGFALGQAAVQGEKDGQASASPSKATIQAGKWLGQGLVIGINRMGKAVYDAGSSMGKEAVGSISKSVNRISDAINSDLDVQPTIRPVLDLSDVSAGAGAISSMLNTNPIGVMANIGTISSMMSRRGQNGAESEVVSAINKLRKDIGNMPRESYNINGVTYDDGSNVATAVREIVRAARTERRV